MPDGLALDLTDHRDRRMVNEYATRHPDRWDSLDSVLKAKLTKQLEKACDDVESATIRKAKKVSMRLSIVKVGMLLNRQNLQQTEMHLKYAGTGGALSMSDADRVASMLNDPSIAEKASQFAEAVNNAQHTTANK